ncbi:hypothetical protein D3C85_1825230 [compost metagenome]
MLKRSGISGKLAMGMTSAAMGLWEGTQVLGGYALTGKGDWPANPVRNNGCSVRWSGAATTSTGLFRHGVQN